MLLQTWTALCRQLKTRDDIGRIASEQPQFSYDTLFGILEQLNTRHQIKNSFLIKQQGHRFVEMYDSGRPLVDIARHFNLSPTFVARKVIELLQKVDRKSITRLMQDPSKIADERLRRELERCIELDHWSGPWHDRRRHVVGLKYEHLLLDELRNLGLEFESEDDLRNRGCYKTPDVLLRVPVAFRGNVVRWIDSKAKFADVTTLNRDYKSSIMSYVGRYGPGMVIYWFGAVEDGKSRMGTDSNVLIVEEFPREVEMLPGSRLLDKDSDLAEDKKPPVPPA